MSAADNAKRLANLALSESGFLFDATTGHTYSLNATGSHVLRCLIEGARAEKLGALVAERFATDEETATRDAEQFLLQLGEMGLWSAGSGEGAG